MPKERYRKKLQVKFNYICIEQDRKYLHAVVINKTGRKPNFREIINDTQCNIGI